MASDVSMRLGLYLFTGGARGLEELRCSKLTDLARQLLAEAVRKGRWRRIAGAESW